MAKTKTTGISAVPQLNLPGGLFFRQLIQAPEFAEFALILKQLTGLSMSLDPPGATTFIVGVPEDRGSLICQMIRHTVKGHRRCEACDRRHQAKAGIAGHAVLYTCHAGFFDMAIPIMIQGEQVATIFSGQVLPERPSNAGFARLRRRLPWLDIPERQLRRAYNQAPWLPRNQLMYVMRLLEIFSRRVCDSAWRIHELEASHECQAIRRAKILIEERFRDPRLQLSDAAATACLSASYFSHLFHHEMAMTFTNYVQTLRVAEAKRLLRETGKSITQICFTCGFNSLTHFNRVFRRGERCSPRQYRQTLTGDCPKSMAGATQRAAL